MSELSLGSEADHEEEVKEENDDREMSLELREDEVGYLTDEEASVFEHGSLRDGEIPEVEERRDDPEALVTSLGCPLGCGEEGVLNLEDHARVCINQALLCPYEHLGCGCDSVTRGVLDTHLTQQGPLHTALLLESIANLCNEVRRLDVVVNESTTNNCERINKLYVEVERLKIENEELRRQLQRNTSVDNLSQEMERHSLLINNLIQGMDLNNLRYEKRYYEYVWRVPNFKSLVTEAKQDPTKTVISNAFFTSKNGYKVQMILYPNGLGEARDRYISLYYQIMKNKFDDLLSWPFKCNVELRLLDQKGPNDQILNVFFDPSDSEMMTNYERPFSDDVRLYGSTKFVSKEEFSRVPSLKKNDTLFFRFSAKPVNLID